MSSRSIDDLNKDMQRMAKEHIKLCAEKNVDLMIYCTLRPNDEQTKLYEIGRRTLGKIVTNARAGESAHNPDAQGKASAYDCCPLVFGKPMWDTNHPSWTTVIQCGEQAGLIASARWTGKLKESAHFQDPKWSKPHD